MKSCIINLLFGIMLFSCEQNKDHRLIESPIAIVIKLVTAESFKDYDAARKHIDLEQVYSVVAKQEGKSEEDVWKELVEFHYSLGNSSHKFTTLFPFHKYKIIETINGDNSVVKLLATEEGQSVKQITYKLNLQNESWKVVSIEYKK